MASSPHFVGSVGRRNTQMSRSVRLYTAAQVEEVADLRQTVREDRRRATGAARLPVSAS
jgi:hypothetical protein